MNWFRLFCALVTIGLCQVMLCSGLKCYDCQYITGIKKKADSVYSSSTCEKRPSIVELTEFSDTPALQCLSKKSCLFETILKVSSDEFQFDSTNPDQEMSAAVIRDLASDSDQGGIHYCMTLTGKFQDLDVVFRGSVWTDTFYGNNFCLEVPPKEVKGFVGARVCGCNRDGCNGSKN